MQWTTTDLYLAYRHAKRSIFFERRGTGLIEFARFEEALGANLRALSEKLQRGTWFDQLSTGLVWLVPKDAQATLPKNGYIRVGHVQGLESRRRLNVRVLLTPSVEFLICEVLFLWEFGAVLDGLIGPESLGNRLELGRTFARTQPQLFEQWHTKYQAFKTVPLYVARTLLTENDSSCTVISLDFSSFYDNVDARFLVKSDFIREIGNFASAQQLKFDENAYRRAATSLLKAHVRFHRGVSDILGVAVDRGIPIGSLTSRVIANLALAPLDRLITTHEEVRCYRRYVDDILIVGKLNPPAGTPAIDHLQRWAPISMNRSGDYVLDSKALGRDGCEFSLQRRKLAIYELHGLEGRDFIQGIASDLQRVASETRAFLDPEAVRGEALATLARLSDDSRGHRVLRESDRARLANLELATAILALQRIALLLEPSEARRVVSTAVEPLVHMLADPVQWVERAELLQQVLKIALLAEDWNSAETLVSHTERAWGDVAALRRTISRMSWNGRDVTRHAAFARLRKYLHRKRIEAIYGSLSLREHTDVAGAAFSVNYESRRLDLAALVRGAKAFASTDLRTADREDDCVDAGNRKDIDHSELLDDLRLEDALSDRFERIDRFLKRSLSLGEHCWGASGVALFVCTRPPSYFDVARRWLAECESKGFGFDVFDALLEIVKAVRGNKYRDSIGGVIDDRRILLKLSIDRSDEPATRLILGNLCVNDKWFEQATRRTPGSPTGQPARTFSRLRGLATVLHKAELASRVRHRRQEPPPSLLVLPELSLPRAWVRTVARHLVRVDTFSLITGLEYYHEKARPVVHNQAMAIFVGPFRSVATWLWTKGFPASGEERMLADHKLTFPPVDRTLRRTMIDSHFGSVSVLICSEMIEARLISELVGAELIVAPSWNQDTSSYDHLIQSVCLQAHSIVGIANNGEYSDCRAWAPYRERWRRDLCRLIQRKDNDVIWVDLPMKELRAVHNSGGELGGEDDWVWRPLPPGFLNDKESNSR